MQTERNQACLKLLAVYLILSLCKGINNLNLTCMGA